LQVLPRAATALPNLDVKPVAVASEVAPERIPKLPSASFEGLPLSPTQRAAAAKVARKTSFDPITSRLVETSASRKVFRNLDGSYTAQVSQVPVRVADGAGWRDVDLDLIAGVDGRLGPKSALVPVSIASNSEDVWATIEAAPGANLVLNGDSLPAGQTATTKGNTASFAGADKGRLEVAAARFGAKTTYVLDRADQGSSGWTETLSLPAGWAARQQGSDVEILDEQGGVAAMWGGGSATDGANPPTATRAEVVLQGVDGGIATALVRIDQAWLGAVTAWPVRVDPTVTVLRYVNESGAGDSWIRSGSPDQNAWADPYLYAGRHPSLGDKWRSTLTFQPNLPSDADVSYAWIQLLEANGGRCTNGLVYAQRNTAPWGPSVTWNTAPGFTDSVNQGIGASPDGCGDGLVTLPVGIYVDAWNGSAWGHQTGLNVPNYGVTMFQPEEATNMGDDRFHAFHSGNSQWVPELWVDYDRAPGTPTLTAPAADATLLTATPTFTTSVVGDPEGENVKYLFQVATGADGESGQTITSGWVEQPSWSPPDGALTNGATYYWKAYAASFATGTTEPNGTSRPSLPRKFKLDLRLGTGTPSPYDSYGPVSVNLATGNVVLNTATRSAHAVGGDLAASFTYNSQAPSTQGLIGRYFQDLDGGRDFNEPSVMTRRDSTVNFDWGIGTPTAALDLNNPYPGDDFTAKWQGYVNVPATGAWQFGVVQDDGVRIYINNNLVLDRWSGQPAGARNYGNAVALTAGAPASIRIEYFEDAGSSMIQLWAKNGASESLVAADWLTTEMPALPKGWTASADLDGELSYTSLRESAASVVLASPDGDTAEYKVNGTGFTPPAGEDGVLSRNGDGSLTFADTDGLIYKFNIDGTLGSATSSADDTKPGALQYTWT
ncbi:MAG: hypothetical protein H0U92_03160, partial [Actinobacteria bacterium]|nr:hypothetical protein [Actinomycetota bacterium]